MTDLPDPSDLADLMMSMDGAEIELHAERVTVEPGRTLSRDSMDVLTAQMALWVGTRIRRRWDATNEPPTAVSVILRVEVG